MDLIQQGPDWKAREKLHLESRDAIGKLVAERLAMPIPDHNDIVKWMREYLHNHSAAIACAVYAFEQSSNKTPK